MIWNDKIRRDFEKQAGLNPGSLKNRRTGRSTLQAFGILHECYKHPGQWIVVRDHYGTREADKHLMRTIADMLGRLEFQSFEFNWTERSIRLNVKGITC